MKLTIDFDLKTIEVHGEYSAEELFAKIQIIENWKEFKVIPQVVTIQWTPPCDVYPTIQPWSPQPYDPFNTYPRITWGTPYDPYNNPPYRYSVENTSASDALPNPEKTFDPNCFWVDKDLEPKDSGITWGSLMEHARMNQGRPKPFYTN